MSSVIIRPVIVRSYGDEPVKLQAVGSTHRVVEVAGEDLAETIGFPREYVFDFDAGLFDRLRAAHDRGDHATLTRLWRKAQPVELGVGE